MQELTGARHDTRRVLQETDVDGVRTFFVPTGQTPFACLSFRVGLADETLVTHGWTHLLEHLAMHELDNPRIQANASVDLCTTDFYVSGDADDVVDFMRSLCRWLSEPDFAALDHERDVLEAESRSRNAGPTGQHLDYRYGPNGVGLASYRELGLRTADPDRLRSWAHRGFTAQNASLAMKRLSRHELRAASRDEARTSARDAPPPPADTRPASRPVARARSRGRGGHGRVRPGHRLAAVHRGRLRPVAGDLPRPPP